MLSGARTSDKAGSEPEWDSSAHRVAATTTVAPRVSRDRGSTRRAEGRARRQAGVLGLSRQRRLGGRFGIGGQHRARRRWRWRSVSATARRNRGGQDEQVHGFRDESSRAVASKANAGVGMLAQESFRVAATHRREVVNAVLARFAVTTLGIAIRLEVLPGAGTFEREARRAHRRGSHGRRRARFPVDGLGSVVAP